MRKVVAHRLWLVLQLGRKKKTIVKAIKVATLTPESPSTSTALMSNRSISSVQASEGDSSSLRLDPSDPGTRPSKHERESIALGVINDPKEEEDMNDLRVKFKERHRKLLYQEIDMVPPSQKGLLEDGSGRVGQGGSSSGRARAGYSKT